MDDAWLLVCLLVCLRVVIEEGGFVPLSGRSRGVVGAWESG